MIVRPVVVETRGQTWKIAGDYVQLDVIECAGTRRRAKRVRSTVTVDHTRQAIAEIEHLRQVVEREPGRWDRLALIHHHRVERGSLRPRTTRERDRLERLIEFVRERTVGPIEGMSGASDAPVRMLGLLVGDLRPSRLRVHGGHLTRWRHHRSSPSKRLWESC